jgi:hypothetical protein
MTRNIRAAAFTHDVSDCASRPRLAGERGDVAICRDPSRRNPTDHVKHSRREVDSLLFHTAT